MFKFISNSIGKYVFLLILLVPVLGNSTESFQEKLEQLYELEYPERYHAIRKHFRDSEFETSKERCETFIQFMEIEHEALKKNGNHPFILCELKNDLAANYSYLSRRDVASILAQEIAALVDEQGTDDPRWKEAMALSLSTQAKNYRWDYQYDLALEYQNKAVALMREAKNPKKLGRVLGGLGVIVSEMGELRKAMQLYDEALEYATEAQDTSWILRQQFSKANVAITLKEIDLAKSILIKIIPEMKDYGHSNYNSSIRVLARLELELENFEAAKFWLDSTAVLVNASGNWHAKAKLNAQYVEYYTAVEDYESALQSRSREMIARDSLNKNLLEEKRIKALADFDERFKEKEIEELKLKSQLEKANLRNWIFGLFGAFFLAIGAFAFWIYRQKQIQNRTFLLSKKEIETRDVRQKLLTSITHELRTPLAVIIGKLQSLQKANLNSKNANHVLTANQNAQDLIFQIDQLLEWNKVEANALQVRKRIGNLNLVLSEIVQNLETQANSKSIKLKLSILKDNFQGELDFEKFRTIAKNLISNAIKYSSTNKKVKVVLSYDANQIELKVVDQGSGIPENQLDKIFDWYYRVANSDSKDQYEGFGIGLALSNQLAVLMGGKIEVDSTLGEGSTFRLLLPFFPRQKEILDEATMPSGNGKNYAQTDIPEISKVLIIEDHEDLAAHIKSLFSEKFEVHVANDVATGQALAKSLIPDCIISDIMLPDGSGLELCKKIKAHLLTNHIPIVLLTARTDDQTKFTGLEYRADAFLTKPFNNLELQLTVNGLLQNRKVLKLRYNQTAKIEASVQDPFVVMVEEVLEKSLADSSFGAEQFAAELSLSKGQLYRKLKATLGNTPTNLLKNYRLEKANVLLKTTNSSISEIAYQCGFSTPEYFSTVYKTHFNQSPSTARQN